jgi:hypothetical protein
MKEYFRFKEETDGIEISKELKKKIKEKDKKIDKYKLYKFILSLGIHKVIYETRTQEYVILSEEEIEGVLKKYESSKE